MFLFKSASYRISCMLQKRNYYPLLPVKQTRKIEFYFVINEVSGKSELTTMRWVCDLIMFQSKIYSTFQRRHNKADNIS